MTIQRKVMQEAISWLGTPYHHNARVKGAGVDCAMLLCEVFERSGAIPKIEPEQYPHDWHLHKDKERFLQMLDAHGERVESFANVMPGDVITFKFGRCFSHGSIYIGSYEIIHAYIGRGVIRTSVFDSLLKHGGKMRDHVIHRIRGPE